MTVKQYQKLLQVKDYYSGAIDGNVGPLTRTAAAQVLILAAKAQESGGGETVKQDEKLILDIKPTGSRPAAERLISAYYDEIYIFVYRQTGNKEDAMDLTQEIFLAVLRSPTSYDRRKASFRPWLYRFATNKIIDARRRIVPNTVWIEDDDYASEENFAECICDRLLLLQIERYVSALSLDVQAVFRLHLYGEKPFPEIAEILGQPESAIKARYYRLMNRLRKEFGNNEGL